MCFSDTAQYSANYHHRNQQSSRPATALFSCAADALIRDMRLPRLMTARTANAPANDAAGGGAPHRPAEEEEPLVVATKKVTKTTNSTTTTATATTPLPRAFAAAASASDPAMRRCQSARPRESDSDNADREFASTMQRTRSHSQKTAYMRTRELPIPAASGSPFPESGNNAAEESDLVRMYDYATWNMYERIVSARRKRLAQIDLQQRREAEEGDRRGGADPAAAAPSSASAPRLAAASDAVAVPSANKREERQQQQQRPSLQTLNKNLSHDENSTLATADETDRASTTSSWSRADSPLVHPPEQHGLPSLRRLGFPSSSSMGGCAYLNNEERRLSTTSNNEEDAFIFELDL